MVNQKEYINNYINKIISKKNIQIKNKPSNIDVIIESSGILKNIDNIIKNVYANGRIVMLARSGDTLFINDVDHIITNNISICGSRGHLCGAFKIILDLHKSGRINLSDFVTSVVVGLDKLKELLENNYTDIQNNCKIVVKIN